MGFMDTEKTQLFVKLAETGNYNRAAQLCHISPSKLSRVIQSLETELGATLLDRNNRHVSLTAQGKTFLLYAREQLQQWQTLKDAMTSASGKLSGSVSIYCSVTASYSFLYEILSIFRHKHPLIQIKLHTGDPADSIDRVNNGQEDIAIAAKPNQLPAGLSFKQFNSSPLKFIQSIDNTHFEETIQTLEDDAWREIPMIVSERGISRQRFDFWVKSLGFTPKIYSEVAGNEAIVSMVSLGLGVGLVPQIVVENSPLANRVKEFIVQPNIEPYEVGACVQSRRLKSPLVNALWQLIQHKNSLEP